MNKSKAKQIIQETVCAHAVQHTPGPWEIWGEQSLHITGKASAKGRRVCSLPPMPMPEDQANARLIACAPEMLVEIERYLSIAKREGWYATVSTLEKLIARAQGK